MSRDSVDAGRYALTALGRVMGIWWNYVLFGVVRVELATTAGLAWEGDRVGRRALQPSTCAIFCDWLTVVQN